MTRSLLTPAKTIRYRVWRSMTLPSWPDAQASGGYLTRNGHLIHPLGIATIDQWRSEKGEGTFMQAVGSDGLQWSRWWDRAHPDRTVARLARELLEEINR